MHFVFTTYENIDVKCVLEVLFVFTEKNVTFVCRVVDHKYVTMVNEKTHADNVKGLVFAFTTDINHHVLNVMVT